MAISPMTRAEAGTIASASDYNVVLDNVEDVDSRLGTLEDSSDAWFHGWVSSAAYTINGSGGPGGVNFYFGGANLSYAQRGGFTVSSYGIYVPTPGNYLVTAQAAWLSGTADPENPTTGMYVVKDGTSGAASAIAAKETKFPGNENAIIEQISGVARFTTAGFLVYRLWTNTTTERQVRGLANTDPGSYGGTYVYITRDAR